MNDDIIKVSKKALQEAIEDARKRRDSIASPGAHGYCSGTVEAWGRVLHGDFTPKPTKRVR